MGWEFRKNTPSDNVMVPATADPFESPKWAPPVWHMPPALVLAVNLIRALVRLVVFLVRHPIATLVAAALGWLTYAFGWQLLAVLATLTCASLGCWAAYAWPSFLRLIARPARARWRHVFVYRRHWQPVMVMSGLAFYRNAREYLPAIKRVRVDATTDRVLVKMLSGQAPGIWRDHAENLAHGFGAALCRIRTANRPGHVWLEFVRRDALAQPLPALPIAGDARAVRPGGPADRQA